MKNQLLILTAFVSLVFMPGLSPNSQTAKLMVCSILLLCLNSTNHKLKDL